MPIGAPKSLTACRRFFLAPTAAKHRQYEALRAYFVEGRSPADVARAFGYTAGAFRTLCYTFRRDRVPAFFATAARRPPDPAEEVRRARDGARAAQTQLLDL